MSKYDETPISARIIKRAGQSALVEFLSVDDGKFYRVTVPGDVLTVVRQSTGECLVPASELRWGIPYGDDWEDLLEVTVDAELLAQELRRHGIWTLEDLLSNSRQALSAFFSAVGHDYNALLRRARQIQSASAKEA